MGQKKLINATSGDLMVTFYPRQGDTISLTDTTGGWNWTVPAGQTMMSDYAPETYLNAVQAQYLNAGNGEMADAGIQAIFKSNADDDALNMNDTITFSLQGTDLNLGFSNTWT